MCYSCMELHSESTAKLDGSSDGAVSSLKSQLHSAQAQFNEAQQENKTLKQQLATSREEVGAV